MSFLSKLFGKRSPRLVVIGLDGTPHTFLQRMIREGRMPNFERITQQAGFTRMNSVYPTVSSVAWPAVDEPKDAVPGRVDAGHIAAPGHRRDGRVNGLHAREPRLLGDPREIGHTPLTGHALQKGVRCAVQPEHYQARRPPAKQLA